MAYSSRARESIKATGSAWKDKLRRECLARLEAERSQLLDRARRSRAGGGSGAQEALQEALHDIIHSSSTALNGSHGPTQPSPHEGGPSQFPPPPGPALGPKRSLDSFFLDNRIQPLGAETLTAEEYQDLMQSLEEALYKDQLREEAEYLDALDQQEIDIMIDSHMADEMRASPGGTPAVICPICHESGLVQRQGVILCPKRHLRIDIGIEGLGLEDVRQRLAGAYEVHAARGCVARPVFEQRGHLGMSSLFMHCGACGTLEVVL